MANTDPEDGNLGYSINLEIQEFDKALSQIEARLEKIDDKLESIERRVNECQKKFISLKNIRQD